MDLEGFVTDHLTHPGCRVLEIGCGSGELAQSLGRQGFEVTAIDPEAPDGPIFRRTTLEDFSEDGPFDAVVASRSLHHIPDLNAALEKIDRLLADDGVIILNEFAWDRADESAARWFMSQVHEPDHEHAHFHPDEFPERWTAEHEDMHDSEAMSRALEGLFEQRHFEWVPYMTDYYLKRPDLVEEEEALIEAGEIRAMGFRYVGVKK